MGEVSSLGNLSVLTLFLDLPDGEITKSCEAVCGRSVCCISSLFICISQVVLLKVSSLDLACCLDGAPWDSDSLLFLKHGLYIDFKLLT